MILKHWHEQFGVNLIDLNDQMAPGDYGDVNREHGFLRQTVGLLDLSFRGRVVVLGADRQRFLNGQVTNDVRNLTAGQGCYAALTNAKARMVSDLNIYVLADEILLDFEPGLTATVIQRLEKYIVADDVQLADAGPHFGLLSLQGPRALDVLQSLRLSTSLPATRMAHTSLNHLEFGELYLMNCPRLGSAGFDLYVPVDSMATVAEALRASAAVHNGGVVGWRAFDIARIEAGIPRFGVDMDESNLAPETGLESMAIRYDKGCYIGQEIIARIRTYGQVTKSLRALLLSDALQRLPSKGEKLFLGDKEVGYITSATHSPALGKNIGLGYVRREANEVGTMLKLKSGTAESDVTIVHFENFSKSA